MPSGSGPARAVMDMPNETETRTKRAPDPRPARTRAAILDAIERIGESGGEVNVAAVVAEAQLSRSSFYSQFKDLGDVAIQLVGEISNDVLELDLRLRSSAGGLASTRAVTTVLFTEMQRRRGLFAAVLGGAASEDTRNEICRLIARSMQTSIETQTSEDIDHETVSLFVVAGMLAVTTRWLLAGCPFPVEELQRRIFAVLPDWMLA